MMRSTCWSALLGGLLLGLGAACDHRPQVTMPDKIYPLPPPPVAGGAGGARPAAPKEKTEAGTPSTPDAPPAPEKKEP